MDEVYKLSKPTSNDMLSPARLYLLKSPYFSQTEVQTFKYVLVVGGAFLIQTPYPLREWGGILKDEKAKVNELQAVRTFLASRGTKQKSYWVCKVDTQKCCMND